MVWIHPLKLEERLRVYCPDQTNNEKIKKVYNEIELTYLNAVRIRREPEIIEICDFPKLENPTFLSPTHPRVIIDAAKKRGYTNEFLWFPSPDGGYSGTDIENINFLEEYNKINASLTKEKIKMEFGFIKRTFFDLFGFIVSIFCPNYGDIDVVYNLETAKEILCDLPGNYKLNGNRARKLIHTKILIHFEDNSSRKFLGFSEYID